MRINTFECITWTHEDMSGVCVCMYVCMCTNTAGYTCIYVCSSVTVTVTVTVTIFILATHPEGICVLILSRFAISTRALPRTHSARPSEWAPQGGLAFFYVAFNKKQNRKRKRKRKHVRPRLCRKQLCQNNSHA
jgi:hypothetical protein